MIPRRAAAAVAALLVAACAASAPDPGKVVAIERLCDEPDDTRVRLTGWLRYRRGLMSFCQTFGGRETCDLALYATAEAPTDFDVMRPQTGPEPAHARLSVPVGGSPGQMDDLPERFLPSDVKLRLEGGGVATEGTRVTIDGKLSVIPGGDAPKSCYVDVEWAQPAG